MLSILMLSKEGEGYEVGTRLAQEGNLVKVWIREPEAQSVGKGYKNPQRVSDYKPHLKSADLIIFGATGLGDLAQRFTKMGKVVLGGGQFHDLIEFDRAYGLQVAKSTKALIPDSIECKTVEEGLKILEKIDYPIVLKPFANRSCGLTLVSPDSKNEMIKAFLRSHGKDVSEGFLLQKVVDGIEISTEGWFNGLDWLDAFNHTIEHKRLMEGDKGPNTGCQGAVVWFTKGNKIVNSLLKPLTPLLKKVKFVGPIDANVIVSKDQLHFLEWTPRFGYDAVQIMAEGLRMPLTELLYGCATGTLKKIRVNDKFNIGVALTVSPWPSVNFESLKEIKGYKVVNIPPEALRHFWPADVMLNENEEMVLAGAEGKIGCITAYGDTVREARRRVYRTIENIKLTTDLQYRDDIGVSKKHNVEEQIKQLQEWGWLEGGLS